tara:strand:+ start:344 stop:964 length:621 start_codon:yes stop_codon:yes gene_type:complete
MSNISLNNKTYKSRNIILNILKKRGFDTSEYEYFSQHEIHVLNSNNQLDMLLSKNDGKKCYIKYHLTGKLTKGNVYDYIEDLYNIENILTKDDDLIIVIKDKVNDTLKKFVNGLYFNEDKFLLIYNINRYLFNILEHDLVPTHIPLNNEEKLKLEKKYNIINSNQWPEICRFDPIALAIGLRPNQLCRIIRKSPTAGETLYYRLCI